MNLDHKKLTKLTKEIDKYHNTLINLQVLANELVKSDSELNIQIKITKKVKKNRSWIDKVMEDHKNHDGPIIIMPGGNPFGKNNVGLQNQYEVNFPEGTPDDVDHSDKYEPVGFQEEHLPAEMALIMLSKIQEHNNLCYQRSKKELEDYVASQYKAITLNLE